MSFVRLIVENADTPTLVNADCRTNILLDHCKKSVLGATIEQLEAREAEAMTNVSMRTFMTCIAFPQFVSRTSTLCCVHSLFIVYSPFWLPYLPISRLDANSRKSD